MKRPTRRTVVIIAATSFVLSVLLVIAVAVMREGRPPDEGRNLLTASRPADVQAFEVREEGGGTLWRIESGRPAQLRYIAYGRVPGGFRQSVPAEGAEPKPFTPGEVLLTITVTDTVVFEHRGQAIGPRAFMGGAWKSTPLQRQDRDE